jgi:hypothetical protein
MRLPRTKPEPAQPPPESVWGAGIAELMQGPISADYNRDDLFVDGVWVGPRSLRVFVRVNRLFVAWWAFGLTFMSMGLWAAMVESLIVLLPLAIATGAAATACLMFAFSRGWVGDGD